MQPHDLVGGRLVAGDAKPAPDCPLVEAEGDRRGFASQIASIAVRNRLTAGGRRIRTLGPRVMDGDLGRQVPALIAVFELAGTAVALQCGTKRGLAEPSSRIPVTDS
jgi:hypothetical protein